MTTQKYLHELLRDDQEPFRLKNYIADRKCQLKRPNSQRPTTLQVIKRNPITETSPIAASKRNLCVHSCFLAFNGSPEITKSPFPNFLSPGRSPCRNHNGSVFLHVPACTASLLLDAALKIQKQQSTKPKTQIKNLGLGLFSSILKKLKDRKRSRKREIGFGEVKNIINSDLGISGSLDNTSRISSCRWSESNEGRRSLDMETSSSSLYENSDEMDLVLAQEGGNGASKRFCSSPLSPFRFSLQRSPSSGGCTPIFASPSASPTSHKEQEESFNVNLSANFGNEEENEKDQSSPVSVLDPPFENEEEDEHESLDDDDDYEVECSFALVQRAKEKLLYKLSRFERLAELDPIELEKRMQDEEEEYENGEEDDEELLPLYSIDDSYVTEVLRKSDILQYSNRKTVSSDVEKLVSDLIYEEKEISSDNNSNNWLENREIIVGRVCTKLERWKAKKSNTIDMMAEFDMRYELDDWKRFQEQREETCFEFEVAILGLLVEEFTYELLQTPKITSTVTDRF